MNFAKNAFDILMRREPMTLKKPLLDRYRMMFDGGSRGNPGICGAGAIIFKNNKEAAVVSELLPGNNSNNYAEYMALILGLKKALEMDIKSLEIEGDSLLVINQCKNIWQTKNLSLIPLNTEAKKLCNRFDFIKLTHIPRHKNKIADRLANKAMDTRI